MLLSIDVFAAGKMNISALSEKENLKRGEEISVVLKISNDYDGLIFPKVKIQWNSSQLKLISFEKLSEEKILRAEVETAADNIIWSFAGRFSARDAFDALKLSFKVKNDAPYGKSKINLSSDSENIFSESISFSIECANHIADPEKDKWEDGIVADCTGGGTIIRKCSVCLAEYQEEISASGHKISNWKRTKIATCTTDGEEEGECESCGETVSQEMEALGHSFNNWETEKTVGCSEDGKEIRSCKRCGEKEIKTIEAKGHKFGEAVTVKEPTEYADGLKESKCARCGAKLTEIIPKLTSSESSVPQIERENSSSAPIKDSIVSAPIFEKEESLAKEEIINDTDKENLSPKNEKTKNSAVWYIIIPIALVLIGAGTAVFIILKRKTKVYNPTEEELPF